MNNDINTPLQENPENVAQAAHEIPNVAVAKKSNKSFLKSVLKLFTPNQTVDRTTTTTIILFWIVCTVILWMTSKSNLIPTPVELVEAGHRMFTKFNLLRDLVISLGLALRAMAYAIIICYVLATLSTLEFFRPIASFFAKARFLTTVGLSVVFAQLTPDASSQKTAILVFGITVFLVTSFLSVIMDIRKEEFDYAKTLKMSPWKAYWEIVVLGKADLFIDSIRQNFAIAWMMLPLVENLCRADGGIGIVLTDQNKYFHLDHVYAIQIMVLIIGITMDWIIGYIKGLARPDTRLTLARK